MKTDQKFTPKYWVGHHKQDDDVLLQTANKSRLACCELMESFYGEDWFMDENFDVILVEIRVVDVK